MKIIYFIFAFISLTACTKENEIIKPIYPETETQQIRLPCFRCGVVSDPSFLKVYIDGRDSTESVIIDTAQDKSQGIYLKLTYTFKDSVRIDEIQNERVIMRHLIQRENK